MKTKDHEVRVTLQLMCEEGGFMAGRKTRQIFLIRWHLESGNGQQETPAGRPSHQGPPQIGSGLHKTNAGGARPPNDDHRRPADISIAATIATIRKGRAAIAMLAIRTDKPALRLGAPLHAR